jgi:DNA polymerase-3 subunit gamma/tau
MRELIENAVYAPTAGRFKVYIIDEVHMLSKGAFNAMLKTLEEPPPHVKFILATTDPQKIPVTVLSRCLQFGLKHISPPVIAAQLAKVLDAEQVAHEAAALPVIARAAAGSMRDSLSLLDQAIAFGSGAVRDAQVREMIGLVDARWLHALLEALADGDGAALMAQADALLAEGLDFETVLQSLASLLHRVAMAQVVPAALADDEPDRDAVLAMAARFDAEAVQLHYQIALRGRADLDLAPDAYTGFTMTLLRMLAFRIDDGSAPGGATRQGEGGRPAPRSTGAGGSTALPDAGGASTARTATAAAPEPEPAAPRLPVLRPDAWPDCVATLGLSGMPLVLAEHTWLRSFDDGHLALGAPESKRALVDSVARDRLEAALRERLGSIRVEVSVEPLPPEADTVASRLMRAQDAARRAAHDAIERDPFVQAALETLNARIRPGSVRPVVASDPRGEARP